MTKDLSLWTTFEIHHKRTIKPPTMVTTMIPTTMMMRFINVMVLITMLLLLSAHHSNNKVSGVDAAASEATTAGDLYKLLGVKKTATTKEIKQAYRRKALDTHPDKNKNIPADQAAAAFHAVVQAFEVLSDPNSRQHYDRTGRTSSTGNSGNGGGGGGGYGGGYGQQFTWTWNFNSRPKQRLKDKFEVQQAQSRVLHIVSLEQLKTIMLDDNDQLERNILLCFVTSGSIEKIADEDIVFPYPFAGMSSQGIWWEDFLQTALVRFHRKNDVATFFNIPSGDVLRESGQPIFVFGRRGQIMNDIESVKTWPRLQTSDRNVFETWAWQQVQIEVLFVNHHSHPVEIYWIHGTRAHLKETSLAPGATFHHTTMLTHEWHVRDTRVDTHPSSPGRWKLTEESTLQSWKFTNDTTPQTLIIPRRLCFDLSGHCTFWKHQGECSRNPDFMNDQCPLTCNVCSRQEEEEQLAQLLQKEEQEREEAEERENARLLLQVEEQLHHQEQQGSDEL